MIECVNKNRVIINANLKVCPTLRIL